MTDYHTLVQELESIVKEAGQFMLGAGVKERSAEEKTNSKDLVTIADVKSQNIIRDRLKKAFPDIIVVSEEDSEEERIQLEQDDFTGFVIDPIDGTYNFKRDIRESAVSIGYIEAGEAKAGSIYDPYKDELYTAIKGEGAFCNGAQIHVSDQDEIKGASVATSNSYDDAAMARNLRRHLGIYEQLDLLPWTNCPGSGVIIMANVARGRFDAYHHNGLKPWDNAAAFLLVREAGGVVECLDSELPARFTNSAMLMGNKAVVTCLRDVFVKLDPELLR